MGCGCNKKKSTANRKDSLTNTFKKLVGEATQEKNRAVSMPTAPVRPSRTITDDDLVDAMKKQYGDDFKDYYDKIISNMRVANYNMITAIPSEEEGEKFRYRTSLASRVPKEDFEDAKIKNAEEEAAKALDGIDLDALGL